MKKIHLLDRDGIPKCKNSKKKLRIFSSKNIYNITCTCCKLSLGKPYYEFT